MTYLNTCCKRKVRYAMQRNRGSILVSQSGSGRLASAFPRPPTPSPSSSIVSLGSVLTAAALPCKSLSKQQIHPASAPVCKSVSPLCSQSPPYHGLNSTAATLLRRRRRNPSWRSKKAGAASVVLSAGSGALLEVCRHTLWIHATYGWSR